MSLDVKIDDSLYFSDSISNGRLAKKFFQALTNEIFNKSHAYYSKVLELTGDYELNLLMEERNLYSMIGSSIDRITPVHVSEWNFGKNNDLRTVDFCCTHKESSTGNPINYFIEIKKGYYCLNQQSKDGLTSKVKYDIEVLVDQVRDIKAFSYEDTRWFGFDNIYMGLSIIHGYYRNGLELYDEKDIRDSINQCIDKRIGAQLITSTWFLPDSMRLQWEQDKCKFITINGIILSKQK